MAATSAVELTAVDASAPEKKYDEEVPDAVSFFALYRYAQPKDIALTAVGLFFAVAAGFTMPSINLLFGELLDAAAEPVSMGAQINKVVMNLLFVALAAGALFFAAYTLVPIAASNIVNDLRGRYLSSVMRQDQLFFDGIRPGKIAMGMEDGAQDVQYGMSTKLVEMVCGLSQFFFGFVIAFYFNWQLTLVLLSVVPLMAGSAAIIAKYGESDGLFGKEAYNDAAGVASETLSNMRTVASFNAEPVAATNYEGHLGKSEKAAIKQGMGSALGSGILFGVMWATFGLGFWYGGVRVANSRAEAYDHHPLPDEFIAELDNYNTSSPNGTWYPEATFVVSNMNNDVTQPVCKYPYKDEFYTGEALYVCVCGLPWNQLQESVSPTFKNPQCGCGHSSGDFGSVSGECVSGGNTIMVFFSVLLGAFMLGQVGPGAQAVNKARAAAGSMYDMITRVPLIDPDKSGGKLVDSDVKATLTLKGVHFEYPGRPVFKGLSLEIPEGQTVALVGESGCGKSTLAELLLRFYDPSSGAIFLNGLPLPEFDLRSLRRFIGVVSQEPLLFDLSIMENVRLGNEDASDAEVKAATKAANAYEFIKSFPLGFDTKVGAGGGKLSGGQKQRVAIARAILRDPGLMILDEATSALDNESERVVQKALDKLASGGAARKGGRQKMTTVVIAHRLSTVRSADRIVVLGSREGTSTAANGSELLETGTHEELMALEGGVYRALVGTGDGVGEGDDPSVHDSADAVSAAEAPGPLGSSPAGKLRSQSSASAGSGAETGEGDDDGEDLGAGGCCGRKKKKEKKEEVELYKVDSKRLWGYSKPEYGLIFVGSIASAVNGATMPGLSFVFSKVIVIMYSSDTSEMKDEALKYGCLFWGLAFLSFIVNFLQIYLFEIVGERLTKRIRSAYFRALLRQNIGWFDVQQVGALTSALSTDVKLIRRVTGQSLAGNLQSSVGLAVGFGIAFYGSWQLTLTVLALVPLLGLTEFLQWMAMSTTDASLRVELAKVSGVLNEMVAGIREVQCFGLEPVVESDISSRLEASVVKASTKMALSSGMSMAAIQVIQIGFYVLAFYIGGIYLDNGYLNFEDFNIALWGLAFGASSLGAAAAFMGDMTKANTAKSRVFEIIDRVPEIDSKPWEAGGEDSLDGSGTVRTVSTSSGNTIPLEAFKGDVVFEKVCFAYPTRIDAQVFHQTDLVIQGGQTVALVGSSGSGKSTVVQLLERFYDPILSRSSGNIEEEMGEKGLDASGISVTVLEHSSASGAVRIDGRDIRDLDLKWLRSIIGLVGQEPVLFNESVIANIRMGKPDATREEVVAAATLAHCHDFISELDEGYDTPVGNRGGKLSGGQKQRVAIARALLKDPRILLLDEATSALDNDSEAIVQASLDKILAQKDVKRTTIIIAHRLSTIRNSDCIFVLDNAEGEGATVVESGTHDELMALDGKYTLLRAAYDGGNSEEA